MDQEDLRRIARALEEVPSVDARAIAVTAEGDGVALTGSVPSVEGAEAASSVAKRYAPSVVTRFTIDREGDRELGPKGHAVMNGPQYTMRSKAREPSEVDLPSPHDEF